MKLSIYKKIQFIELLGVRGDCTLEMILYFRIQSRI